MRTDLEAGTPSVVDALVSYFLHPPSSEGRAAHSLSGAHAVVRSAALVSHPEEALAADTARLLAARCGWARGVLGGTVLLPARGGDVPAFALGFGDQWSSASCAVLDPGAGEWSAEWVPAEPLWCVRGGYPGRIGPLCSGVAPGRFMVRLRCEDAPVVGLAHLWLRHLPRWFLARMACVNIAI